MQTIKQVDNYKCIYDPLNGESTILNSHFKFYRDFFSGKAAEEEIRKVSDMEDMEFIKYCVDQINN